MPKLLIGNCFLNAARFSRGAGQRDGIAGRSVHALAGAGDGHFGLLEDSLGPAGFVGAGSGLIECLPRLVVLRFRDIARLPGFCGALAKFRDEPGLFLRLRGKRGVAGGSGCASCGSLRIFHGRLDAPGILVSLLPCVRGFCLRLVGESLGGFEVLLQLRGLRREFIDILFRLKGVSPDYW